MKCGIIEAISDCRLDDALLMLEHCQVTKPVELGHGCMLNALTHSDDAYAHALIAKIEMSRWPDTDFVESTKQ